MPNIKGNHHTNKAKIKIGISTKNRWKNNKYKKNVSELISIGKMGKKFTKKHKNNLKKNHNSWNRNKKVPNIICKHHIDLNKNNEKQSNILMLTASKHALIHLRAYEYMVELGLINKYIKWFDSKYRLF